MASNNTIVISFSIALFLLLILLLLITYSSKCQMDNVETFLGNPVDGANRDSAYINKARSVAENAQETNFSAENQIGAGSQFFEDAKVFPSDPTGNSFPEMIKKPETASSQAPLVPQNSEPVFNPNSDLPQSNCYPRDRLSANDLLPQGANSKWAKVNPAGSGDIQDQNFLTAGYHIGINTVGQSLRNANRQLRYEPPNPQIPVSPWGISTIEPDNRVQGLLDIGSVPDGE